MRSCGCTIPVSVCQVEWGFAWSSLVEDRIIESPRLGNTSKIIQSNHSPTSIFSTKPCPLLQHLNVSWTPTGVITPPLPRQTVLEPVSTPDHSFKDVFPNVQSESPPAQHESKTRRNKSFYHPQSLFIFLSVLPVLAQSKWQSHGARSEQAFLPAKKSVCFSITWGRMST